MTGVDPQDAGTIVSIVVEDQFRPADRCAQQVVVVRVQRHLRLRIDALPQGTRVRPAMTTAARPRHQLAVEHITFSATFSRYEATRIVQQLRRWHADRSAPVRVSTVRALMKSVRLPHLREHAELEECL